MTAGVNFHFVPTGKVARPAVNKPAAKKDNLFARAFRAVQDAQMRVAERRIAQYIQDHGGRITDRIEREIGDMPRRGSL